MIIFVLNKLNYEIKKFTEKYKEYPKIVILNKHTYDLLIDDVSKLVNINGNEEFKLMGLSIEISNKVKFFQIEIY